MSSSEECSRSQQQCQRNDCRVGLGDKDSQTANPRPWFYVLEAGLLPPPPPFSIRNLDQLNKEGQAHCLGEPSARWVGFGKGVWSRPCPVEFLGVVAGEGRQGREKRCVWALGVRGALAAPRACSRASISHLFPRSVWCPAFRTLPPRQHFLPS